MERRKDLYVVLAFLKKENDKVSEEETILQEEVSYNIVLGSISFAGHYKDYENGTDFFPAIWAWT